MNELGFVPRPLRAHLLRLRHEPGAAAAGTEPDAAVDAWVSTAGDLGVSGASLHTGFILEGEGASFDVLWCSDTTTTADDAETSCTRVR